MASVVIFFMIQIYILYTFIYREKMKTNKRFLKIICYFKMLIEHLVKLNYFFNTVVKNNITL